METKIAKTMVIKYWDSPAHAAVLRAAAEADGLSVADYVRLTVHRSLVRRSTLEVPLKYSTGTRQQEEILRRSTPEATKNKQKQETSSSSEAKALTTLLVSLMQENMPDMKPIPDSYIRDWEHEADLMVGRDGRTWREAELVLRWCQADPFWKANIRSIPKFRKKYEQLKMKMEAEATRGKNGHRTVEAGGRPELGQRGNPEAAARDWLIMHMGFCKGCRECKDLRKDISPMQAIAKGVE